MADVRCDDHVGEVHPPRCLLCESLSADYSFLKIAPPGERVPGNSPLTTLKRGE